MEVSSITGAFRGFDIANDLPVVIVRGTFKNLLDDQDLTTFINAILVCQQWHEIGIPILWKDVSAYRFDDCYRLINCCKRITDYACKQGGILNSTHFKASASTRYINSFTFQSAWVAPTSTIDHFYGEVLELTQYMPNLKRLSLTLSWICNATELEVPSFACLHMLRKIPKTVESLELTIFAAYTRDIVDEAHLPLDISDEVHMCDIISDLVPQLKHLRLHCGSVCKNLFRKVSKSGSKLESLVVNSVERLICGYAEVPVCVCNKSTESTVDNNMLNFALSTSAYVHLLPRIQNVNLFNILERSQKDFAVSCIVERNVLEDQTICHPFRDDGGQGGELWWIRSCIDGDKSQFIDVIGTDDAAIDTLEGTSSWLTTAQGWRLPRPFRDTLEAKSTGYVWEDASIRLWQQHLHKESGKVFSPEEFWEAREAMCEIIAYEVFSNQQLVIPNVTSGLSAAECLIRTPIRELEYLPEQTDEAPVEMLNEEWWWGKYKKHHGIYQALVTKWGSHYWDDGVVPIDESNTDEDMSDVNDEEDEGEEEDDDDDNDNDAMNEDDD